MSNCQCQEFQIAIEKQLHGALLEEEVATLEKHFASCTSCQNFADTSKELQDMMHKESLSDDLYTIQYETLREKLRKQHKRAQLVPYLMAIPFIAFSIFFWVADTVADQLYPLPSLFFVGCALLVLFLGRFFTSRRQKEFAKVEEIPGELIAYRKKELEKQVAWVRFLQIGMLSSIFFQALLVFNNISNHSPDRAHLLLFFVSMACVGAIVWVLYLQFIILPSSRRELKELSEPGQG